MLNHNNLTSTIEGRLKRGGDCPHAFGLSDRCGSSCDTCRAKAIEDLRAELKRITEIETDKFALYVNTHPFNMGRADEWYNFVEGFIKRYELNAKVIRRRSDRPILLVADSEELNDLGSLVVATCKPDSTLSDLFEITKELKEE